MRAARIDNGVIADLWEVPALDCYGPLHNLIEAPEWVQIGAQWDGEKFTNPAPPPKTKQQLTAEIDKQRDAALSAGFTFNGALYHCDHIFQSQVQAFLLAWQVGILPTNATVAIRRKDDTTVQVGRADMISLAAALMQHIQGIYASSWTAKDALK